MDVLLLAADTTTLIAALGGTLIGGLISLLTTWLQNRHARAERQADAVAARRARVAEILGRVRVFLTDVEPARVGFNVNAERTPMEMDALAGRLNMLRDEP